MQTYSAARPSSTFFYRFLMSPRMRAGRYILLIAVLTVISVNQALMIYQNSLDVLGGWVYVLAAVIMITVVPLVCFDLYYLVPKLLLNKRYVSYFASLSGVVIGMLVVLRIQERIVYFLWLPADTSISFWNIEVVLNYISSFLMNLIGFVGVSITILLKLWMKDHKRVEQLEKKHLQSELEQLKQQISPDFLFKVLHQAGTMAVQCPEDASQMLMKLSRILRYQLYDSVRSWVLLSAEITFLSQYLDLEEQLSGKFRYTLASSGAAGLAVVPPLLFIPYVQLAVECANRQPEEVEVHILLEAVGERVVFVCRCPGLYLLSEESIEKSRQRLTLLYMDRYVLQWEEESLRLEVEGGTPWKK